MFERFTREARAAVVEAQHQARRLGAGQIEPQHLLLGLTAGDGPAAADLAAQRLTVERMRSDLGPAGLDADALAALGIDLDQVRAAAEAQLGPGALDVPRTARSITGHIPFTKAAKKSLELTLREALAAGAHDINGDAFLLGLLREGGVRPLIARLGGDAEALAEGARARLRATAA
jgi:ATP-dependent Clp protease ATP-binding subunit ClpA